MTDSAIPWNNPDNDKDNIKTAWNLLVYHFMRFDKATARTMKEKWGLTWNPREPAEGKEIAENLQDIAEASRATAVVVICIEVLRGNLSKRAGAGVLKMHPHTLDRHIDKFMEVSRRPEAEGNPFAISVLREFGRA